jgi:hypothetical protein
MGKAADNEAIKLDATYWNNLAVSVAAGGVFVAYLGFFRGILESPPAITLETFKDGLFHSPDVRRIAAALVTITLALFASRSFYRQALREIAKLQD